MKYISGKLKTNLCHSFLKVSGVAHVFDPKMLMIYFRVIENLAGNIKINEWKSCIKQPIKTIKIRAYGWILLFSVCILVNFRKAIG